MALRWPSTPLSCGTLSSTGTPSADHAGCRILLAFAGRTSNSRSRQDMRLRGSMSQARTDGTFAQFAKLNPHPRRRLRNQAVAGATRNRVHFQHPGLHRIVDTQVDTHHPASPQGTTGVSGYAVIAGKPGRDESSFRLCAFANRATASHRSSTVLGL